MSTELEDRLRAGLREVPARVPPGLARTACRRHRRRRIAARTGTAAVATIAAGTAAIIAVTAAVPSAPTQPGTTAYVVSRITSALASVNTGTVIYNRQSEGSLNPSMVSWATVSQWRWEQFTAGGLLASDTGVALTSTGQHVTSVYYPSRQWWQMTMPGQGQSVAVPPACGGVPGGSSPAQTVNAIRHLLSCGALRITGNGHVDGAAALRLTGTVNHSERLTVWIDPHSYLPARMTITAGSALIWQDDLRWLPPTPGNLAKLSVPIPPGFTKVPPGSVKMPAPSPSPTGG